MEALQCPLMTQSGHWSESHQFTSSVPVRPARMPIVELLEVAVRRRDFVKA
jgi:hypothetical protein